MAAARLQAQRCTAKLHTHTARNRTTMATDQQHHHKEAITAEGP